MLPLFTASSYLLMQKICFYEPGTNLTPVLTEVICFGAISGLKVNWAKSIIFPLTPSMTPIELDFPLQWSSDPVRYLGIQVHTDSELVLSKNYGKAVSRLEEEVYSVD